MDKDILFIATQSEHRKRLLSEAKIFFKSLDHKGNEESIKFHGDFHKYVLAIARHKMDNVLLPDNSEYSCDYLFVLTADSLTINQATQEIYGKPKDRDDARRMLKDNQCGVIEVATACCLEKKMFDGKMWKTFECNQWVSSSKLEFHVPSDMVDLYLDLEPGAMFSCGAGVVEGFGLNFVKSVNGSYSTIIGLPIYELRQALYAMSFSF